ncbi:hypothetical protein HJFPF1_11086 [Paramyrothecium foliicola]|nr:hypothetical protein HJFPF1_11086 [Paramyrothecium foliicola]
MEATAASCEHPVFKIVVAVLQATHRSPNPEKWTFVYCAATASTTQKQCSVKMSQAERAKKIYEEFKLLDACTESDEFFVQLEEFLAATHCRRHHGPAAIRNLSKWRQERSNKGLDAVDIVSEISDGSQHDVSTANDGTRSNEWPISDAPERAVSITSGSIGDVSTMSTASHESSTSQSTVAPVLLVESPTSETTRSDTSSQEKDDVRVEVKAVAESLSALDINAPKKPNVVDIEEEDDDDVGVGTTERFVGFGLTKLQRQGSIRDPSPVIHELYKSLTRTQQKEATLYVLQSKENEDWFRIGHTTETMQQHLSKPGNCNTAHSNLIYQSHDGPFFGAAKAEKLVKAVLFHHNYKMEACKHCGGGHRDWFQAPRSLVEGTVEVMENFVRLPAYESLDGQTWKLSAAAHEKIKVICGFSPEKLQSVMTASDEQIEGESQGDISQQMGTDHESQVRGMADRLNSLEVGEGLDSQDSLNANCTADTETRTKQPRESSGTGAAKFAKNVTQGAKHGAQKVRKMFQRRSRAGTAEPEDGDSMRQGPGEEEHGATKDAVESVLLTLFPKEFWPSKDEGKGGTQAARDRMLWVKTTKRNAKIFVADFKEEWHKND